MPTRDAAPLGAPCWIDLFSSDPDRAETFYGEIFGWTAEHSGEEFGGYVNFRHGSADGGGALVAGMMRNAGSAGMPDVWSTYLAVADAKAATEAAVAAGGRVLLESMQVGELGSMGMLADPGGAAIGLWQPGAHRGYGLIAEAGAPAWHELHTRDYAASLEFYRTVFGWQTAVMSDTDEFRYTNLVIDGEPYAGVMDAHDFLPEGMPAGWQTYIGCVDVDRTLETVQRLGGEVVMGAEDSPFGRLAQIADPTGAIIKLVSV
jgi:predicted enzyme related to lactoylglutathione lyase